MTTTILTQDNFDSIVNANDLVLIDFWAAWCGPCRVFGEIYEALSEQYSKQYPEIIFAKVDVEKEQGLAQDFNIRSIPNLIILRSGIVVYDEAGALTLEVLETLIKEAKALDITEIRKQIELHEQGKNE